MYKNYYDSIIKEVKEKLPKKIDDNYALNRNLLDGENREVTYALCGQDISKFDLSKLSKENLARLCFDSNTNFSQEQLSKFNPFKILEIGKQFGLHLDLLHKAGINGTGINVAVIDRACDLNNSEMLDSDGLTRVNLNYSGVKIDNVHGKTVTTLLCGRNVGVAPNANLYFFATNFNENEKIGILEKIKELNKEGHNISVISMSSYIKDLDLNDQYTKEFNECNCALINSNNFLKKGYMYYSRNNYLDINEPRNFELPFSKEYWESMAKNIKAEEICLSVEFEDKLFIPCGGRTYLQIGNNGYMYDATCAASWTIPQVAGLFALAKQLNPLLTFEEFTQISRETCYRNKQGYRVVNPEGIARQINEINKEKVETDDRYKDIYSESQKLIDALDEVMRNQEVDTQKLGQETMQEQNDTAYINETEQVIEELENLKGIEDFELE